MHLLDSRDSEWIPPSRRNAFPMQTLCISSVTSESFVLVWAMYFQWSKIVFNKELTLLLVRAQIHFLLTASTNPSGPPDIRRPNQESPVVHRAMGCSHKSFKLYHQLLFAYLANDHLPRVSRQSHFMGNTYCPLSDGLQPSS